MASSWRLERWVQRRIRFSVSVTNQRSTWLIQSGSRRGSCCACSSAWHSWAQTPASGRSRRPHHLGIADGGARRTRGAARRASHPGAARQNDCATWKPSRALPASGPPPTTCSPCRVRTHMPARAASACAVLRRMRPGQQPLLPLAFVQYSLRFRSVAHRILPRLIVQSLLHAISILISSTTFQLSALDTGLEQDRALQQTFPARFKVSIQHELRHSIFRNRISMRASLA